MDAGKAEQPATHLGAELEKLTKMVAEVEVGLLLPVATVTESQCHGPELSGVLSVHIDTVMQLQSEMSRIICQVDLLHSILA